MRALAWLGLGLALGACASSGNVRVRHAGDTAPATAQAAAEPVIIRVAPGDCLWRLARRHLGAGSRWPALAQANGLGEPYLLRPGQALRLPATATQSPQPLPTPTAKQRREAARYGWRSQPNRAYSVGERLHFAVQYAGVTAGYATLSIPGVVEKEGRPCYHILAEARTRPFFETFFKVRDRIESFIDVDHGFSWGYEKHIREGGYSADAVYVYDQRAQRIREPGKILDNPMPKASQDVLSCFYLYRTLPMEVGQPHVIPVTADDGKSYELKVDVLRRERVQTLAGAFDCLVVQPHMAFQGVFQQKGEVFIWISDDERRLPVLIRSKLLLGKLKLGSININLQDAEWVEASEPGQ